MGNYGCGCTGLPREEASYENVFYSDLEEVIEFHPETYRSIHKASQHPPSITECKQTRNTPETAGHEIQGELHRVQRSYKEILVPRWCMLKNNTFSYYKNQYSAFCKEKPLFSVRIDKLTNGRAYKKQSKFFLEVSFLRDSTVKEAVDLFRKTRVFRQ
jgi:hypothetical protein